MLSFLIHIYTFAEVYTVLLVWVAAPISFFTLQRFLQKHYGMFVPGTEEGGAEEGGVRDVSN